MHIVDFWLKTILSGVRMRGKITFLWLAAFLLNVLLKARVVWVGLLWRADDQGVQKPFECPGQVGMAPNLICRMQNIYWTTYHVWGKVQNLRIQRETACLSPLHTHPQIYVINAGIPKQWSEMLGLTFRFPCAWPHVTLPGILLVDAVLTTAVQMVKLRPRKMNRFPEHPEL